MANGSWQLRDALGSNGTSLPLHGLGNGHHSWSNRFVSNRFVSNDISSLSSLNLKSPSQGATNPLAVVWHPSRLPVLPFPYHLPSARTPGFH